MTDPVTRLNAALKGRYTIERELGEGGMATVYLADDLKHERKVALKVLKPELAAVVGAERFLAEIKTTARLQHPHILPLHDSGEADGFLFYVMPYVEGETLRDRIDREKQLPVDEAVALASKVAGALHHAHEHGVIHRDIKPGNILLQDGEPVVADFGIALAVGGAGSNRLTETGLSLGTPYYMSPEQATGDQAVGASTDTYALGSVLYEMLVGDPPYAGSTAQAVLGKIVAGKHISATEERPSVPANVDGAIRKALEKLPADRFTSALDFAKALADEHFRYGEAAAGVAATDLGPWKQIAMAGWGVALLVVVFSRVFWPTPTPLGKIMTTIPPPPGHSFVGGASLALSPDGSRIVFGATADDGSQQLWLHPLDGLFDAAPLANTDGGDWPFWSPDGQTLGFFADERLWKLDLASETRGPLCEVPAAGGATWSGSGEIVYASGGELWSVPSAGGDCSLLYANTGPNAYRRPTFLPDGNHFLFSTISPSSIMIGSLDRDTLRSVESDVRDPLFIPPRTVIYAYDELHITAVNHLRVADMNMRSFAVADEHVVVSNIRADAGILSYTASRNGTLAYLSNFPSLPPLELDRSGQPVANILAEPQGVWSWDVGRERLFLASEDRGLFRYDWEAGGTPQPLYPKGVLPVAGPGDTLVAFLNWRADSPECSVGVLNVNTERVDTIIPGPKCYYPTDWSPDGEELLLSDQLIWLLDGTLPPDIWAFSFADDSLRRMVEEPQATAWRGTYSPDGERIAFGSDRTGRFEVYVQPRDGSSRAGEPISRNGGVWPRWGDGGRELYFLNPQGDVLAAVISDDDPGPPTRLFSLRGWTRFGYEDGVGTLFDVAPNGDRFFVSRRLVEPTYLVLIQNGLN